MQNGVSNMDSPSPKGSSQSHGSSSQTGYEPCPKCGSKDNLARYDDGHGYCYGCSYYEHGDSTNIVHSTSKEQDKPDKNGFTPLHGEVSDISKRHISEDTAKRFSYSIGEYSGERCHIASFKEDGRVIGQKLRFKDKSFKTFGDCSSLWGKHLWGRGKKIVITEGEIDAMSVAESQNCKWPVVSIPNGAQSAKKAISKDLEWLLGNFDEIILMFDMDAPGQEAAKICSELFPPGRCLVASLPEKDASDVLTKQGGSVLVDSIWKAKVCRPDGIVAGEDTWDLVLNKEDEGKGLKYPWENLNEYTLGARRGELVTFCAGTGAGKSTAVKEIASYFLSKGETIGYIALEESVREAAVDFMSIEANEMLHLRDNLDDKFCRGVWESVFSDNRLYLYDHWGSIDVDIICNRIRYLVHNCGVGWIVLDHVSIMVSGVENVDERRLIDNLMTKLKSLTQELNVGMFIVSHLKRPTQGKGHEDGKQISLSDLRGSGSIAQLSNFVIGLERNQQEEGETNIRVLKARYKGSKTGLAGQLYYNGDTGRLKECGSNVVDRTAGPEAF